MRTLPLYLVLPSLLLAACSQPAQPSSSSAAAEPAVEIRDSAFAPATVTASTGQAITWTNADAIPHTVTFDSGPDSGELAEGQTYQTRFDAPGTYRYVCVFHPDMTGSVTVA